MTPKLTVLQALDSERYRPDAPANWAVDLAHVRSEVVTTLLAGRSILLTANDVGDSPGVQQLLSEFMSSGEAQIASFNADREPERRYAPFVIGLEDQYRGYAGNRGYAAFVAKRREAEIKRAEAGQAAHGLKAIGKASRDTGLPQHEILRGMASTYLAIEETAVGRLKAAHPGIWSYAGMVRRCFHEDALGYEAARYCPGNPFTDGTSLRFGRSLTTLSRIAGQRSRDTDRANEIEMQLEAILRTVGDLPTRAAWTANLDGFGTNREIVRDWLDFILFDRVFMAFSSADQVFFTQQCAPDVEENRFRMAVLSEQSFEVFRRKENDDGRLRPSVSTAPWHWLVPLLLSTEFRGSLAIMENEVRDLDRFADDLDRKKAQRDAMQAHVSRLAGMTKDVTAVERDGALIDLQVASKPLGAAWQEAAKSSSGGAILLIGSAVAGMSPPASLALGVSVAAAVAGVGFLGAVEKLRRPKQLPGSLLAANLAAEPDHINWRITRY